MNRTPLVAANWKMNMTIDQGSLLLTDLLKYPSYGEACEIWVFPTAPLLAPLSRRAMELRSQIQVGAQDVSGHESGAYTGEISASILKSAGAYAAIVGHSERRQYHGETEDLLASKVRQALDEKLQVILCVGEHLEQRDAGEEKSVVLDQLEGALSGLSTADMNHVVVAYEPVWAIGTGRTAEPDQVQDMHAHIRMALRDIFDEEVSSRTRILYGGSVKPQNAEALFALADVDGGLIGGASLKSESFMQIVAAAI